MSDASQRAQIHLHRGNLAQARHWCEEAVKEARKNESSQNLISALGNLGNVCAQLGEYAEAEACYHEVLSLQRREHNPSTIGETLVNLGNLKADAGTFETAKAYYLEAIDVLQPIEHHRALGILYNNLALMELATKQPDDAVIHFQRALECHRVVGDELGLANTFSQFGKALLAQGDVQQAERCLNNASEHFIKLGQEPSEAAVLRLLADIYETRRDYVSALRCVERAVHVDQRYRLPEIEHDQQRLVRLQTRGREAQASSTPPPATFKTERPVE